ncbi:hypothetical protein [Streptomyces sp. NBC_01320]|nr:hypothetical protein OG395_41695 [Streptomyces sp. NBC_01320]
MQAEVIVVRAGLAGLVAAHELPDPCLPGYDTLGAVPPSCTS